MCGGDAAHCQITLQALVILSVQYELAEHRSRRKFRKNSDGSSGRASSMIRRRGRSIMDAISQSVRERTVLSVPPRSQCRSTVTGPSLTVQPQSVAPSSSVARDPTALSILTRPRRPLCCCCSRRRLSPDTISRFSTMLGALPLLSANFPCPALGLQLIGDHYCR